MAALLIKLPSLSHEIVILSLAYRGFSAGCEVEGPAVLRPHWRSYCDAGTSACGGWRPRIASPAGCPTLATLHRG